MATGENEEPPTMVEMGPDSVPMNDDAAGLESRLLLARARERLLGANEEPAKVGRYRVIERLGTGGMGVVYAAHDDELDRPVAIKILRTDVGLGSAGRQRLLREAQAIAKLSHPNIVHVYEVGQDVGQVYMAMELVRGVTLRRWCESAGRTWQAKVEMFATIGDGLAAAHATGIVHRDFKPENALVGDDGRPRVVDFGLARPRTDAGPTGENPIVPSSSSSSLSTSARMLELDVTVSGTVVGTPAYMAPEQLERAEPDARTDQFSFCASLYEMLYGKRPFPGSSYTELAKAISGSSPLAVDPRAHGVPPAVHAIIVRGLRRDRDERFVSMDELVAELRKTLRPPPSGRRVRVAMFAGAGLVAAAAGVLALRPDRAAQPVAETASESEIDPWAEVLAASDLPPVVETPLPGDPANVTVHRLPNGLTVYLAPRPTEPYVAVLLAVRAGVREESERGPLLGFFVLEAIYRGTAKTGVVDPALEKPYLEEQHRLLATLPEVEDDAAKLTLLRAVAAAENATAENVLMHDLNDATVALGGLGLTYESGDGATLLTQVPRHRLGAALELVAEASRRPVFRDFFASTQAALASSPQRTAGWHGDRVARHELKAATGLHGDYDEANEYVRTVPFEAARQFHATYYRPNNAALIFVGDVTATDVLPLVERAFGDWEPGELPPVVDRDVPLAEPVVRKTIEDSGPPSVTVSWPLPPPDDPQYPVFVALADSLSRRDGLGAELQKSVADSSAWVSYARALHVSAYPKPGQTLDDAEAAVMDLVGALAEDRVAPEVWARTVARAQLQRSRWAFSAQDTALSIGDTFIARRAWNEAAPHFAGAPDRAALVGAAKVLAGRSRVVVQRKSGKTWQLEDTSWDAPRMPVRYGRNSAWVRELLDTPVAPPEPRFLVEGSHYQSSAHGAGRIITVQEESPLVRMNWVYPTGVDEDPFACEAIKAHLRASTIAGVDFDAYCTNDDVWVDVTAASAGFAERAPEVFAFLANGELDEQAARDYVDYVTGWRESVRADPHQRESVFHAWALRGEHGIDAQLPSDAELRKEGARALPVALARVQAFDPDVNYVGPALGDFSRLMPKPTGNAPTTSGDSTALRDVARPTVLLLNDPDAERVSVRAAMPWKTGAVREELAAQIHDDIVVMAAYAGPGALQPVPTGWHWWTPLHPMATIVAYRAAPADLGLAIDTAIDVSGRRVDAEQFSAAHRRLEITFRASRLFVHRVPERVRLWGRGKTDPRVEQWMALPALTHADMTAFYAGREKMLPIVSVVANVAAIDLAALRRHGEVVQYELEDLGSIVRDNSMTDVGI